MKNSGRWCFLYFLIILTISMVSCNLISKGEGRNTLLSPGGALSLEVKMGEDSILTYNVYFKGEEVLLDSRLGVIMETMDFSEGLTLDSVSEEKQVYEEYTMSVGKRSKFDYMAVSKTFYLSNREGELMDIIFRASDDGIVFRYRFPGESQEKKRILEEVTSFNFLPGTEAYIQRLATPQSGWSNTNPSYEEYYHIGTPIVELPDDVEQWIYPALFRHGDCWILISETSIGRDYCGSRLSQAGNNETFKVEFPDGRESFTGRGFLPESKLPWETPWRIMVIGNNLSTITESTLGTDMAKPPVFEEPDFVQPGKSSWSWVLLKDDSIIFEVQKEFIEYAAEMKWEFCLVDVNWDTKIGYNRIGELSEYAQSLGIGLILWYNSSGDWNETPYHPKSRLLNREDRRKEFSRLEEMGIKGIKVDFFAGDGRSMIEYYQDIFEDAADYGLMVNCHGCTLPRGWHRTYPNLVTMESVRGFEFVTFEQFNASQQPSHCCMLPFTRNVFDPMDFTPVCFSEVPGIERVTTNGFELALSVLFWSGVQHIAEIPRGMEAVPDFVREFMMEVPSTWDEIEFIDGFPGSFVILARRSGDDWYLAGINGEKEERNFSFSLRFLPTEMSALIIADGDNDRAFRMEEGRVNPTTTMELDVTGFGGFVVKCSKMK